jgi:Phenazine biosynthesis-like protein
MQQLAAEFNLSETTFVLPLGKSTVIQSFLAQSTRRGIPLFVLSRHEFAGCLRSRR